MEPENIDWSNIESTFEEDSTYEFIDAPKWVDLSDPHVLVDDDTWFCKTNCKHPKTVEGFLKPTRNFKVKFLRSMTISEILPFKERRDVNQKAKETHVSSSGNAGVETKPTNSSYKFNQDYENQKPNSTTPPLNNNPNMGQKKEREDSQTNSSRKESKPGLKSTFSARNLVAGREVLGQITEFCSELKKLARNGLKKGSSDKVSGGVLGELKERVREKERRPLLVVNERDS